MERESKDYSWRYLTASGLVSHGPCDLVHAHIVVGSANNYVNLYDGESTTGDLIVKLQVGQKTGRQFSPKAPVFCRRGLYVEFSSNTDGCFIQWRELGHEAGG